MDQQAVQGMPSSCVCLPTVAPLSHVKPPLGSAVEEIKFLHQRFPAAVFVGVQVDLSPTSSLYQHTPIMAIWANTDKLFS